MCAKRQLSVVEGIQHCFFDFHQTKKIFRNQLKSYNLSKECLTNIIKVRATNILILDIGEKNSVFHDTTQGLIKDKSSKI